MRVTVSHKKSKAEVSKIVNDAVDQLFTGVPGAPVQITNQHKQWEGDKMNFSFTGKMGFFTSSLKGNAHVTDQDVTIELDLPPMLKNFVPEDKLRAQVESRVKGLLA